MFLDIATKFPNLIGGSADLAGSNNTKTKNHKIIKPGNFSGNYIHYGVREHAMCGIMNGIALHSNLIPYGGTFLIFSDYCKPSIRLAAMMKQRVIYIFTHDSIGLGEDGPTHQPIEQLTSLRSIPNLNVFRPSDLIETFECWQLAIESKDTPSVIALTRQGVDPVRVKNSTKNESSTGAYEIFRTGDNINVTIIATGSETSLAKEVSHKLATEGIYSKVISMPCQELFDQQDEGYKNKILNETKLVVTIEASEANHWKKYTGYRGLNFGINDFGKSAPYKDIYNHFKLNPVSIIKNQTTIMSIKVGINGMGRIGRMIIRSIIENNNKNIDIKHINNRTNSEACSNLLKYDSIHGKFNAEIDFDEKHLIINNKRITFSQETDLNNINWKKHDVDYVFECTGKFNSKDNLIPHLIMEPKKL